MWWKILISAAVISFVIAYFVSKYYYVIKIKLTTKRIKLKDIYGTIDYTSESDYVIEDYSKIEEGIYGVAIGFDIMEKTLTNQLDTEVYFLMSYFPPDQPGLINSIINSQTIQNGGLQFHITDVTARKDKKNDKKILLVEKIGRCEVRL